MEEGRGVRRLFDTRILFAVLSIVIASVMWLYVATDKNPVVERIMTLDVHVRDLSPTEVVVQAPNRVQVRLQGSRSAVAPLTPDVLDASLDLQGLGPGEHRVRIDVATPAGDVRVVERTPPEALVVLDQMTLKRLSVEVSLIGTPPAGITLGAARTVPERVTISGASEQVQEVRHAVVTVDTARLQQQLLSSVPIHLLDANGQEVHSVVVDPSFVQVTLPVRTGTITKLLPVIPTLAGAPAPGLSVTSVTALPQTVTVSGPGDALQTVQTIATAPIDIRGARRDVIRDIAVVAPSGVTSSPQRVTVAVRIGSALLVRLIGGVPVRAAGVAAGLTAHLAPDHLQVTVSGPEGVVAQLAPSAVVVRVDVTGLRPGAHQVTPTVVLPGGTRVLSVSPAQVTVTLAPTH